MSLVKKFFGGHAISVITPEPVAAYNREQSLLDELHEVDAARDRIGEAMKDFRQKCTATVDGVLVYQAERITDRTELDAIWGSLLSADSKLLQNRNRVLAELARIRVPSYVS
jgi:hypothetical protein